MYYLRKEPYEVTINELHKTDGTIIPARQATTDDRAVYKHHDFSRFYRGGFHGTDKKYQGMKVYQCKTLKRIMELREDMHRYCNEYFDVYDENGKVSIG